MSRVKELFYPEKTNYLGIKLIKCYNNWLLLFLLAKNEKIY